MKNKIFLICVITFNLIGKAQVKSSANNKDVVYTYDEMPKVLPATKPLTTEGDLSTKMLKDAHKFIEKKIDESGTGNFRFRDIR